MLAGWFALICALLYLLALFAVAHLADRKGKALLTGPLRPVIYALALAVYCTSWTFLGSVGLASRAGLDFLPIYLGPILLFAFGWPMIARVVQLARSQNITSVADFLAARFGKSQRVAALVTLIAVIGVVPYIALQLKAISASLEIIVFRERGFVPIKNDIVSLGGDLALLVAAVLAIFAIAFGTRHIDATEHQDGLVTAVAMESLVKLICFLTVGIFVVFFLFDGFGALFEQAAQAPAAAQAFSSLPDPVVWITTTALAAFAALLLPRQFHVTVVENRDPADLKRAAWMFPLYLVAINIFVVPIALAGLIHLPGGVDRDLTVLAVPLETGAAAIALIAFIGALSAATAMVIVETVALAIMVSNDLIVPMIVRRRTFRLDKAGQPEPAAEASSTMVPVVLRVRRYAIIAIIILAYAYYRTSTEAALATIGLLSFAAIAQLAPSFFAGLYWRGCNARGATAGLIGGFLVWFYTLLLPTLATWSGAVAELLEHGPFGLSIARPHALFVENVPQLVQGVLFSLAVNVVCLVAFSLTRKGSAVERLQADAFLGTATQGSKPAFRLFRDTVSTEELRATVARYLGKERADQAFEAYERQRGAPYHPEQAADAHLLRHAEHLLASAIGAASSRLVLSLMLRRRMVSTEAALKLLDDTSAAIQYSRDVLQHALDHAHQGVTVFDRDLRLVCWNRAFVDLYDFPPDLIRFGIGLDEILAFNANRGTYGGGEPLQMVAKRLDSFLSETQPLRIRLLPSGKVIETRANHLPDGGVVTTYTDVSETVAAEQALEAANESLEQRVRERTEELTLVNGELGRAKLEAEEANLSKTRFLAAASHDILQPLNAARLYASSLMERIEERPEAALAANLETSLDSVEEILSALLEMSRLDSTKMKPELAVFSVSDLFRQLEVEFAPMARKKGLKLRFVDTRLAVRSDRRLLRRALQNLISNALKYTEKGGVVIGCRPRRDQVRIEVHDSGLGIPASKQKAIFKEFQRLEAGARAARGLGLGLSIVDRIGRLLGHPVAVSSVLGTGSSFSIGVPRAAPIPRPETPQVAAPAMMVSPAFAGLSVLVIDNEPAILSAMQHLLGNWGCHVTIATSLPEAEARMKEGAPAPAVLMVDFHLDDADGIEVIKALRWRLGALPAVLVTAERSPAVRNAAKSADIHMINKPVKPAALRALLAQFRLATASAAE